jgi:hypothetical protein
MSLASVFNQLGQDVIPTVLAAAFPDTCTITAETTSAGTGGGRIKSGTTVAYADVPCAYEPIQKFGWQKDQGDKIVSTQIYMVTIPTHTAAGTRISLDPKTHRIVVAARGNEPAKTFRIQNVGDQMGVVFEIIAAREN